MTRELPVQGKAKSRNIRLMAWILFAILFCTGVLTTFSYGQPWDEQEEMGIMISNIGEYASYVGLEESIAPFSEKYGLPKISESEDKDHGMASYYLFFLIYLITGYRTLATMYAWHLYTFLIFFSGVVALFCILKELFCDPVIWFGGTLSYFLTPRFFAEGHYNDIDLVCASLLLITLLCLIRFLKTDRWKYVFLFSLFSGFLMNCRVLGIVLWASEGFFAILYQIIRKKQKPGYRQIVFGFFLSLLIYFILTPASWNQPIEFVLYCLGNAQSYSLWNKEILFNGNRFRPAESGLPWSYLPKWILMTVPEQVVLLFAISCAVYVYHMLKRCRRRMTVSSISDADFFTGLFMFLFWVPLVYLVIRAPHMVLYNGWRHCYFLYVPMILISVYALGDPQAKAESLPRKVRRWVLCAVLSIGLLSSAIDILHFHPHEYVHFNRISRRFLDPAGFEGDYWNVSILGMVRQFEEKFYQGKRLKVALMGESWGGQTESLLNSEKLQIVEEEAADYFLFNVSALSDRTALEPYELISATAVNDYLIAGVYVAKD